VPNRPRINFPLGPADPALTSLATIVPLCGLGLPCGGLQVSRAAPATIVRELIKLSLATLRSLQFPRLRSGDIGRSEYTKFRLISSRDFHLTLNGVV
jgi:hypothetical protein